MSASDPDIDDYLKLFERYGSDLGRIYQAPDDDRYALLFEQVVRLLVKPSAFNLSLPEPFRTSAHRYRSGHAATVKYLSRPANRNFMLCDLHDLIMLKGGLAAKRAARTP
jgi:hypothetical protein